MPIRLRRPDWPLLFASLLIASCVVAIGIAINIAVTGDEGQNLPQAIEEIDPIRGASQVPSQTDLFVDLIPGYEGVLVVDGLELDTVSRDELQSEPGQQVTLPPTTIYDPGNATLTFSPSEAAPITEFTQGQHIVQVVYWKTIEGRGTARSYTWSFEIL